MINSPILGMIWDFPRMRKSPLLLQRKPAFGERSLFAYPPNKRKFVWGDKTVVKIKKVRQSTLMISTVHD